MGKDIRSDYADFRPAVYANSGSSDQPHDTSAVEIDATGYRRACFIFTFGIPTASGSISTGLGIWRSDSAASDVLERVTSASFPAITSGSASKHVFIIDVSVDRDYPYLKVSGFSIISSSVPNAAIVELYNAEDHPPASHAASSIIFVA